MDQQRSNCIFPSSQYCSCVFDARCTALTFEQIYGEAELPLLRSSRPHTKPTEQHTDHPVKINK